MINFVSKLTIVSWPYNLIMEYIDEGEKCSCGRPLLQPPTGRRRSRCFTCSPRDTRDRRKPEAQILALLTRDPDTPDSLTTASRKALEAAGVIDGWQAAAALAVARLVDQGRVGASSIASNIRAHRQCMEFALESATEDAQVLDLVDRIFLDG
jgi:hypothetical protein